MKKDWGSKDSSKLLRPTGSHLQDRNTSSSDLIRRARGTGADFKGVLEGPMSSPIFSRKTLVARLNQAQAMLKKVDQVTSLMVQIPALKGPALVGLGIRATQMVAEHLQSNQKEHKVEWPNAWFSRGGMAPFAAKLCMGFEARGSEFGYHEAIEERGWVFYRIGGQGVAIVKENEAFLIRVQHSKAALMASLREIVWMRGDVLGLAIGRDGDLDIQPVQCKPALPSECADQIWNRLQPFLEAGDPRSVVLDGRPGTGKTVLAEELAKRASQLFGKPRIMHISLRELNMGPEFLLELLTLLRPQVIIINDFDRGQPHLLLGFLEEARAWFRLLVITTNNINFMSSAVIRPGRFDEIFIITGLGSTFVQDFLGDLWSRFSEVEREQLLQWPVAYLEELRLRFRRHPDADTSFEVSNLETRLAKRETPDWASKVAQML